LIAHPEGKPLGNVRLAGVKAIFYLVGPEGGFGSEEIGQAESAGFKPVQLPVGGILRVETAAVAMLAMLKVISELVD